MLPDGLFRTSSLPSFHKILNGQFPYATIIMVSIFFAIQYFFLDCWGVYRSRCRLIEYYITGVYTFILWFLEIFRGFNTFKREKKDLFSLVIRWFLIVGCSLWLLLEVVQSQYFLLLGMMFLLLRSNNSFIILWYIYFNEKHVRTEILKVDYKKRKNLLKKTRCKLVIAKIRPRSRVHQASSGL